MVVRMRRNHSQTAKRRSHHALKGVSAVKCECGNLRLSHTACPHCGKYNGRVVIDVVGRAKREARRNTRRQKELRESGQVSADKEAAKT
jgi:large subunit ribosomal protein L32